jgi:hypothetical protein
MLLNFGENLMSVLIWTFACVGTWFAFFKWSRETAEPNSGLNIVLKMVLNNGYVSFFVAAS